MCCTATILPAGLFPIWIAVVGLTGCSSISADPFDWWGRLEGGAIAQQRPAPPGATDPYTPVEMIPAKPAPISDATRLRIQNNLASDQAVSEAFATADPLAVKTSPNPGPPGSTPAAATPPGAGPLVAHPAALPSPPVMPPPDPNASTATLQTPDAPPPPASPPSASPPSASPPSASPPSASAALPAKPAGKPGSLTTAAASPVAINGPLPPILEGPLPTIPAGPPPLPKGLPEDFTLPLPPPDVSQLVTPIVPGVSQPVTFRTGQSTLTAAAVLALKALVTARGGKMIRVIGRGEAASYDPAVQAKALALALARADAIVEALRNAGLPPSAMRVMAEPFGRGGAALLIS